MNQLLYGAAYYEEYMPYERLEKDIGLLKKAGMNVVRIGESTWSSHEPQEGVFDFSHVTRAIEAMGRADIRVILGTPTYAVPTWMVKSHPEVLAVTRRGPGLYGARQNMDITSPVYLYYAERVIRKMMESCARYDNVIGVQLDNETKAYGTAGPNVQEAFVKYLREKFQDDLDAMNDAFGLSYWSNRINAWEDFPDVRGTINGSLGAEFNRFQRKLAADFLMWQRRIVEPYLREDQFITHNTDFNWIGHSFGLNGEVDVYEDARAMTVVGTDIYHPTQDGLTGMEIAFGGDLTRSVKRDNYLVLETQAQGFPQWLPYDGQLRLQAYSHLASGANMVEYWHWHSLHNAFETYWKGVLSHDFKENETYRACCAVGREWQAIGPQLVNLRKANRAAVLVSSTALKALDWFPIVGNSFDPQPYKYNDVLMEVYRQLYEMNLETDFLFPQNAAEHIADYALVVIPALYAETQELLDVIADYVRGGGHVLATFKTAFADENIKVWSDETPHTLAKVFGISYSHFTYPGEVKLASREGELQGAAVRHFMELLNAETAETEILASYDHSSWERFAAITRHAFGAGTATYIGCGLDGTALRHVIRGAAAGAGLSCPSLLDQALSFPVIIRKGLNGEGNEIVYYFNYSAESRTIRYEGEEGTELLGGAPVRNGDALALKPWDLAVVRRRAAG
ncbi:beta-galactosidase [Lachnoclostridium sp. Marseille-P6806]|uniref:beta-galactosidase n=1 Tax=Lachnoclostridium sp. Marseille-P6806 TaxID=2364793 RepID=UPI00103278ED|nr:beta-galactosidase [Lachnoclostridium sp. Marseille-P6806]